MSRRPAFLLTANLFGIPFSVAGLAQCWATAHALAAAPARPGQSLWVVAGLSCCLLGVLTAGIGALAIRTVIALNRGTFLLRPLTDSAPGTERRSSVTSSSQPRPGWRRREP